jgi:hypothetical protein
MHAALLEISANTKARLSFDDACELTEFRRELWGNPRSSQSVVKPLSALSGRLSTGLKQHTEDRLDQWFETLPFPLASILRTWQATPSQDFMSKHGHLLKFFEATAEFFSVILLSAYKSNDAIFEPHKQKLKELMAEQKLSFQRATFGTWKLVVEYLAKQTRVSWQGFGQKCRMDNRRSVAVFEQTKRRSGCCGKCLTIGHDVNRREPSESFERLSKHRPLLPEVSGVPKSKARYEI